MLYPAVEQAMAAPGATATMRAHHAEIVSRNDRLADTAATVATRCPTRPWPATSPTQLVGLSAILLLHFRKGKTRCCCRCSTPHCDLTPPPRCSPRWQGGAPVIVQRP